MRGGHRLRLAAVSAAASGAILALLFTATAFAVRTAAFAQRREELTTALSVFTLDPKEAFDLREFREAHPNFSCATFGGNAAETDGPLRMRPVVGFVKFRDTLLFGKRFRGQTVVAATDWSETERGLRLIDGVLFGLWAPLTLLVGAATYLAARSVFRPLERLTSQATSAAGANLGERLQTDDRAEFGEFAARLNGMLDRIEETAQRSERFSADAAHELRTPLAILRVRLETALLQPRSPEAYEETLRRAVSEIDRLTQTAESLLRSSRGEVPQADPIDLAPHIREAVERWRERFEERQLRLSTSLRTPLPFPGDRPGHGRGAGVRVRLSSEEALKPTLAAILPDEIRIVLDNLLDNALRFAPAGSEVMVTLAGGDETSLQVQDSGPGVPPEMGERIFERFARADDSRNRASGGAGIGLAVCRRIVTGRGGRMTLASSPQGGAAVGFHLPKPEIRDAGLMVIDDLSGR